MAICRRINLGQVFGVLVLWLVGDCARLVNGVRFEVPFFEEKVEKEVIKSNGQDTGMLQVQANLASLQWESMDENAALRKVWLNLADVKSTATAPVCLAIPAVPEDLGQFRKVGVPSIHAQTSQPSELIIALSSGTKQQAQELESELKQKLTGINRVLVSLKEGKALAGENRNRAAHACKSDLVVFFDSDDAMHPRRLEVLSDLYKRFKPKVMLAGYSQGTAHIPTLDEKFVLIEGEIISTDGLGILGKEHHWVHQGQPAVERSVFDLVKERNDLSLGQDVRFLNDVLHKFGKQKDTMLYIGQPLIRFGNWQSGR